MPFSKRSLEGYLLIDHRASPGISAEFADEMRARGKPVVAVGEGKTFEAPILTCSHCQKQLIVNPLRTRDRAWCPGCDHYLCDVCEAVRTKGGGGCRPFKKLLDSMYEKAVRGLSVMRALSNLQRDIRDGM